MFLFILPNLNSKIAAQSTTTLENLRKSMISLTFSIPYTLVKKWRNSTPIDHYSEKDMADRPQPILLHCNNLLTMSGFLLTNVLLSFLPVDNFLNKLTVFAIVVVD